MTYDLNDIDIPEEVQRMLPYFIKGEFMKKMNLMWHRVLKTNT